jgi:hypothetical protein
MVEPLALKRLCHNLRETTSVGTWNRRSGEEVLGLPARSRFAEGRAGTLDKKVQRGQRGGVKFDGD